MTDNARPATAGPRQPTLPTEVLDKICEYLQLPAPEVLGRERWEHLRLAEDVETSPATAIKLRTNNKEYSERFRTIANFALASKRLRQVSLPILYSHYPGQSSASLWLFVRTLWEQPSKRALVKKVTLDPWHLQESTQRMVVPSVGLDNAFLSDMHRSAADGNIDAMVALLVLLCQDIECMDITAPSWRRSIMAIVVQISGFRRQIASSSRVTIAAHEDQPNLFLNKLRNLTVRTPDAEHSILSQHYCDFLQWPTVKALTLVRSQVDAVLFQIPHIETLILWRCMIFEGCFEIALQNLPLLRRIECSWAGSAIGSWHVDRERHSVGASHGVVHRKLVKYCPRVEVLRVDNRELLCYDESHYQFNDVDLAEARAMKVYALEAEGLWGTHILHCHDSARVQSEYRNVADFLPPNLERLVVLVAQRPLAPVTYEHSNSEVSDACTAPSTDTTRTTRKTFRTEIRCAERNRYAVVRECCRYALAAPSTLKTIHVDLPWSDVVAAEAREHLGRNSGWTVESIRNDEEVALPSPVLNLNVSLQDRAKLYNNWKQWDPEIGGSTTIVLRRVQCT